MPRWKQVYNEELGKNELIPIDEAAIRRDAGVAIHGPIEPFVSPVDGSVISDRKQLREHNKRNNVVNTAEFSDEFLAKKRQERERLYSGERTQDEIRSNRMEINEIINRLERR